MSEREDNDELRDKHGRTPEECWANGDVFLFDLATIGGAVLLHDPTVAPRTELEHYLAGRVRADLKAALDRALIATDNDGA